MKKQNIILTTTLVLIIVGVVSITSLFLPNTFEIDTYPIKSQVWLDGKNVGITPSRIFIFDSKRHVLELASTEIETSFLNVKYEFSRSSIPSKFHVQLLPTDALSGNNSLTSDGLWITKPDGDNSTIYNLQHSYNPIVITNADVQISPNGEYLLIGAQKNDYITFWLAPFNHPDQRVRLFSEYDGIWPVHMKGTAVQIGFSPDSKWVWWFVHGTNISVASTQNPQTHLLSTEPVTSPIWSHDGNWMAITDTNYNIHVFQLINDFWQPTEISLTGIPSILSSNGQLLWIYGYKGPQSAPGNIQLINLVQGEVIADFSKPSYITSALESPDRDMFALISSPDNGYSQNTLIVTDSNGVTITTLDDSDYKRVLYWLEDQRHIAALVRSSQGNYVKIVDVP